MSSDGHGDSGPASHEDPRPLSRQILALAVPALGALVAEPLFLLADTAIIGWLGTAELAGAALGVTVMHTVVGLMVFLAYSTTPAVARFVGAGKQAKALAAGRDGMWLALGLGVVLALVGLAAGDSLLRAMGSAGEIHPYALDYLLWSLPGLPAMLLVFAGVGALRGFQDTKTPLIVAGIGFGANALLNLILVHPLGFGVVGAAAGTSLVQWGMAIAYLVILVPRMRAAGIPLGPEPVALRGAARVGGWMFLRTATLRVAMVATVIVATSLGPETLAAHQVAFTFFSTLAFILDSLAIAAQALIGRELGASRPDAARRMVRTMIWWALGFGVIVGALTAVISPWVPWFFTQDAQVAHMITVALLVLAAAQPLAGYVFVLDGVLMGAGDVRYLGLVGLVNMAVYLPGLWWVARFVDPEADGLSAEPTLWLWLAFTALFMGARGVTLGLRAAGDTWMKPGEQV